MVLTNGFDPDVRVYKEAKYITSLGYNVEILCWDRKCEYVDKTEENMDEVKIKRFHIPSVPGSGMKQIIPFLKFIRTIKTYLKNKEYEYLHCHDFDGIIVGMFERKRKGTKLIFDMHEIYTHYAYAKNCFFKSYFNYVLKKTDYIVYVNDEQIKDINQKEKLVYLPNYPERKVYEPIEKNKSNDGKIRVNYIGSVRDYESLKTLAEIANECDNIDIGIYGVGIAFNRLLEEYKDTNIKLYGKYDGVNQSGEIYRNTDILYCVYNPEVKNWKNAYPVKLYEGIITKTPIIVSKNSKAGEIVEKYLIGEIVDYDNQQELKKAIEKIKDNYESYVKNLEQIRTQYIWEHVVINLKQIY